MIDRISLFKLKDEFANDESRREIARFCRDSLEAIEAIVEVQVQLPADPKSEGDWDLYLVARLESIDAVDDYLDAPEHLALLDDYLRPRSIVIKAWNFQPLG